MYLLYLKRTDLRPSFSDTCTCTHTYLSVLDGLMWTHTLLLSKLLSSHERALQEQWGTVPSVGSTVLRTHRKTSLVRPAASLNTPARDGSTEARFWTENMDGPSRNSSKSFCLSEDERDMKHEGLMEETDIPTHVVRYNHITIAWYFIFCRYIDKE